MKIEEIQNAMAEKLEDSDCVLVGIGAEWKIGTEERERSVKEAVEHLQKMLTGRDYFVISTLGQEDFARLGFESSHTVTPLDVSLTEEEWDRYTLWLSRTLNRKLVLVELGEGFAHPSLIRWPFERTAWINQKAYLFRIHKTLYQITDELTGKAVGIHADSVEFLADWNKHTEEEHGSN